MNCKRKGNRSERKSMALLESQGYAVCRSAASLGLFDVIGVGPLGVVLVQTKSNRWPSAAEMERLKLFPVPAGVRKIVHRWRDRQRTPDVRELGTGREVVTTA